MPYKDKNKARAYKRKWYSVNAEAERLRVSGIRTGIRTAIQKGIRTGSVQGYVQENVSSPVSNLPVVSQTPEVLTEADIARKKLIEDLKAKIATVPAPKPYVPMKPQYVRPIPKMQENYSESVRYDYACM